MVCFGILKSPAKKVYGVFQLKQLLNGTNLTQSIFGPHGRIIRKSSTIKNASKDFAINPEVKEGKFTLVQQH